RRSAADGLPVTHMRAWRMHHQTGTRATAKPNDASLSCRPARMNHGTRTRASNADSAWRHRVLRRPPITSRSASLTTETVSSKIDITVPVRMSVGARLPPLNLPSFVSSFSLRQWHQQAASRLALGFIWREPDFGSVRMSHYQLSILVAPDCGPARSMGLLDGLLDCLGSRSL